LNVRDLGCVSKWLGEHVGPRNLARRNRQMKRTGGSPPMPRKCILAVASKGGHWRQMKALSKAYEGHEVRYVSTDASLTEFSVSECSRSHWWRAIGNIFQFVKIMRQVRPDVVVSTGALPGLMALIVGYFFGARTIWIDSIANTERMSLSGRLSRPFAQLWLTQWPEVSDRTGATYVGAVL